MAYYNCYLCDLLSNDGALIEVENKKYNVCMDCSEKEDVEKLILAKKTYEEIIRKPNVRNAIKDIELEGGCVTKDIVFIMDDYAESRIDRDEMVRKVGLCLRDND